MKEDLRIGIRFRRFRPSFMLLRLLAELIGDVQEGIARQDVGEGLGAALCINGACDV